MTGQPAARQIASRFERDGFAFPIRAMDGHSARAFQADCEALLEADSRAADDARSSAHLVFPLVDRLTRHEGVLDAVESVLGPDILLRGSGFFLKPPHSDSYISWHQDLTYWGPDGTDEVTAWLALSPATVENGCMRFVPGSHRRGMVAHNDSFAAQNLRTRGQEIAVEVDAAKTATVTSSPCPAPRAISSPRAWRPMPASPRPRARRFMTEQPRTRGEQPQAAKQHRRA